MLPTNEPHPDFENTISRLKGAQWISGYRYEDGCGYLLDWTEVGHRRAMLLQQLIVRHQLDEGTNAIRFTEVCLGKRKPPIRVPAAERDFWLACLEQLEMGLDKEVLVTFVLLMASWQPK
jgi:hypothetical protein